MKRSKHPEKRAARAREFFAEVWPHDIEARQRFIDSLPTGQWEDGEPYWVLRCNGVSGKGNHDVNVQLYVLWSVVSHRNWLCPYHTGDAWRQCR